MKNKNSFWKIYARITGLAVLVIVIGLAIFNDFIRAYEIAQPAAAAMRYAESLTEETFISILEDTLPDVPSGFNSRESTLAAYVQALPEDGYTCSRILTMGDAEHPVYGVYSDGILLAHVTLMQDSDSSYGFHPWKVVNTVLMPQNLPVKKETYSIYAPSGSTVTVNGIALSEEWILSDTAAYPFASLFEQQGEITCTLYEVRDIFGIPSFSCVQNSTVCLQAETESEDTVYFLYPETAAKKYDIVVPDGSSVLVNGVALEETFTVETGIPYNYNALEENRAALPSARKYTVSGLFAVPEISVQYKGLSLDVSYDSTASVFTAPYPEELLYTCAVTVPTGSTVSLYGKDCSAYRIAETVTPYALLFAEIGTPPVLEQYQITGLYLPPEDVKVQFGGKPLQITAEQEERMWLYNGEYPVVERPDVENLALAFIQAYFQYTSQGYNNTTANMENSLQYVAWGSDLYKRIQNSEESFSYVTPVTSSVYNILEVEKTSEIQPGAYVCTIAFDVAQQIRHVSRDFVGTVTLYITDNAGVLRVSGMAIQND